MFKFMANPGPCRITITDQITGNVVYDEQVHIMRFSEHIRSNPINILGRFSPDKIFPECRDIALYFKLFREAGVQSIPVAAKVGGHDCQWVTYEGFADSFEYCKICDKRRNEG
jgi:hypothetical protein